MLLKITLRDYNDSIVASVLVDKYKSIASAERYHELPKRFRLDGGDTLRSCSIQMATVEEVS